MSSVSRSINTALLSPILRKVLHVVFSLMLLIPFAQAYRDLAASLWLGGLDPTLATLALLLFGAAFVNSLQVRLPDVRNRFLKTSADIRKRILETLESTARDAPYAVLVENIIKSIARYEERFLEFISMVERDYELRYGYICITFGLLSVTMSYVLFGPWAVYGILALAVVDSVSSIATLYTQNRRKLLKHSDISIAITFAVFTLMLVPVAADPWKAIAIASAAVVTELASPEDNLTLPIITTAASYLLQAPPIQF